MKRNPFIVLLALGLIHTYMPPTYAQSVDANAESVRPPLQIENLTGLKIAIQVNFADTIPNGVGKQVLAAKNLFDQYQALGMKPGKDYDMVIVFRADGAQFLLSDEAYDEKVKQPHPKGNPSRQIVEELSKAGVKVYECGVAMRMKGYTAQELLPQSRIVVSGIGALIDFAKSGYIEFTP